MKMGLKKCAHIITAVHKRVKLNTAVHCGFERVKRMTVQVIQESAACDGMKHFPVSWITTAYFCEFIEEV